MTARDFQRSKVYAAEDQFAGLLDYSPHGTVEVFGVPLVLEPEDTFTGLPAVQTYVDRVLAHPGVIERFGASRRVLVRHRRGDAKAHYCAGVIAVPSGDGSWAMREAVVLHEIAHHYVRLVRIASGAPARASHGPEFVSILVDLVDIVIGPQSALALRMIFDRGGVVSAACARPEARCG